MKKNPINIAAGAPSVPSPPISDRFHLLIDCRDEANQKRLYEQLVKEGFKVRVLTL